MHLEYIYNFLIIKLLYINVNIYLIHSLYYIIYISIKMRKIIFILNKYIKL